MTIPRIVSRIYSLSRCAKHSARRLTKKPIIPEKVNYSGEARPFIDQKQVICKAGDGGDGMVSFRREANVIFGGPDGGNGGNGGHVLFQADSLIKDLSRVSTRIKAGNGECGRTKCCDGRSAPHEIIKVPIGTVFKELSSNKVVIDLKKDKAVFLAAIGGAGGHGNRFYKSNEVRVPLKAELGACGEEMAYNVEMRIMATAGLVGFPNAGKSTLLRAISRAKPKVACYPFTTLTAHIGIVCYEDFIQIAVADIPGLIEGSHFDLGLGNGFLRHISRCRCLFYVLDVTLARLKDQYISLKYELDQHEKGLGNRPSTIIVNKIDLAPENLDRNQIRKEFAPNEVFFISAKHSNGLEQLLVHLRNEYDRLSEDEANQSMENDHHTTTLDESSCL